MATLKLWGSIKKTSTKHFEMKKNVIQGVFNHQQ